MTQDRIEREVLIAATPDTVWSVITQPGHIAGWFGDEAELDVQVGGEGLFTWNDHGMSSKVRVERLDQPTVFAFRWGQGADNALTPETSTLVEFMLDATGDQTLLRVVESGFAGLAIPAADQRRRVAENTSGWGGELADLQAYAEAQVGVA